MTPTKKPKELPRVGRPPLPAGEARRKINLLVLPITIAQLDTLSATLDISRSKIVERAVAELYAHLIHEEES